MKKEIKNLPASIHNRLKNVAIQNNRPFQEYLYYYAIERFLFRLTTSKYRNDFVLKGGLMFLAWGVPLRRSTRDIDVQGYLENSVENHISIFREICVVNVEPDGIIFDPNSVRGTVINNLADNTGVRINFSGNLGNATVQLHVDISFTNIITPGVLETSYPCLLDNSTIQIKGYPIETTISEKFQAMVSLNSINDRMKDFFDIWILIHQVNIDGATLLEAIEKTFRQRKTPLPIELPVALKEEFAINKQKNWEGFVKRSLLDGEDLENFNEVIQTLRDFLNPVIEAGQKGDKFENSWHPGQGWKIKD